MCDGGEIRDGAQPAPVGSGAGRHMMDGMGRTRLAQLACAIWCCAIPAFAQAETFPFTRRALQAMENEMPAVWESTTGPTATLIVDTWYRVGDFAAAERAEKRWPAEYYAGLAASLRLTTGSMTRNRTTADRGSDPAPAGTVPDAGARHAMAAFVSAPHLQPRVSRIWFRSCRPGALGLLTRKCRSG